MRDPTPSLAALPSVVAVPLAEYLREQEPVMKLWHACDALEMILRLVVAVGLADSRTQGPLPSDLVAEIAPRIDEPTLARWLAMAMAVVKHERCSPELLPLRGLVEDTIAPLLQGTGEKRTSRSSFLEVRNQLAHGGGVTRAIARGLLATWEPRLEGLTQRAQDLAALRLIGRSRGGQQIDLSGESFAAAAASPQPWARRDDVVALLGPRSLSLWPLLIYGPLHSPDDDADVSDEPCLQIYTRRLATHLRYTPVGPAELAQAASDADALRAFQGLLAEQTPVAGHKVSGFLVPDFYADLVRDAAKLIGRSHELSALTALVAGTTSGVLWLTGPAGMGKTVLTAHLAVSLLESSPAHQLTLPFRFRIGDQRCSREAFLRFAVERLTAWLGPPQSPPEAAEGARAMRARLLGLLRRLGGKRVLFILDGLDEIAEVDDSFAREIPLAMAEVGAAWLCVGRAERGLPAAFEASHCVPVFPAGLPPMSVEDIRAMLVSRIGPQRRRLFKGDREDGSQIVNDFVLSVARRADGLPAYVEYVIGDILSGKYRLLDAQERLPKNLLAYHEELLRRHAVSSLQQIVTPTVTLLALAREPMSVALIAETLADRFLIADAAEDMPLVLRGLDAVGAMIRRATTPDEEEGVVLFHHSLRQHILASPSMTSAVGATRRYLAARCARAEDTGASKLAGYIARHAVEHLCEARRWAEALRCLQRQFACAARGSGPAEQAVQASRTFLRGLRRCSAEDAASLDAELLAALLLRVDEFDILLPAVRIVLRQHGARALDALLNGENWDLLYSVSLELAAMALDTPPHAPSVEELIASENLSRRQLGAYTAKILYSLAPERIDLGLLRRLAASPSPITRSVVYELLLNLSLVQAPAESLVEEPAFWRPHTAYCRALVAEIAAVRGAPARSRLREEDAREADEAGRSLAALRRDCAALLAASAAAEPELSWLLTHFDRSSLHLHRFGDAADALVRAADPRPMAWPFLAHPCWEVREAMALTLCSLIAARPEVATWPSLLRAEGNWRLRYSAVSMAYTLRDLDGGEQYLRTLQLLHSDPHAWVRGLCAYSLLRWFIAASDRELTARLARSTDVLRRLAQDTDLWALDEVRGLLSLLEGRGMLARNVLADLANPLFPSHDAWWRLDDGTFYDAIEQAHSLPRGAEQGAGPHAAG